MEGYVEVTPDKFANREGVNDINRMLKEIYDNLPGDGGTVRIFKGFGTPESAVVAGIGSIYQRLDGGANTSIYIKESGTGATGWVAK